MVDFFFSVLVGESQQTINAVSRSILHDIIEKRPDLTPIFLKDAWKRAIKFHWQDNTKITIGHKEAWPALRNIIAELGNQGIRLCLFIDGLDEFKMKMNDWEDLVDHLHELSPQSNPHVKMCAASRAEPPFTTRLTTKRIFLHDITRQDIIRFADWRLKAIEDNDDRLSFARNIADKADGIFLWAQLVIENIRLEIGRRVGNSKVGVDILDHYTGDLENLFKDLVDSIRNTDRSKVYRTVRSLEVLQEYNIRLSPLALSFRESASTESDFASQVTTLMSKMTAKEKEDRTDQALIELASISRGFLEANSARNEIKFIHRSARDYLKWGRILKNPSEDDGKTFSAEDVASTLALVDIWDESPSLPTNAWINVMRLRQDYDLDREPYAFLDSLQIRAEKAVLWDMKGFRHEIVDFVVYTPKHRRHLAVATLQNRHSLDDKSGVYCLDSPLHVLVMQGRYDYPRWKLGRGHLEAFQAFAMIAYTIFGRSLLETFTDDDCSFLETLLRKEQVYRQEMSQFIPVFQSAVKYDNTKDYRLNMWDQYILIQFYARLSGFMLVARTSGPGIPILPPNQLDENLYRSSQIFRKFEEYRQWSANLRLGDHQEDRFGGVLSMSLGWPQPMELNLVKRISKRVPFKPFSELKYPRDLPERRILWRLRKDMEIGCGIRRGDGWIEWSLGEFLSEMSIAERDTRKHLDTVTEVAPSLQSSHQFTTLTTFCLSMATVYPLNVS